MQTLESQDSSDACTLLLLRHTLPKLIPEPQAYPQRWGVKGGGTQKLTDRKWPLGWGSDIVQFRKVASIWVGWKHQGKGGQDEFKKDVDIWVSGLECNGWSEQVKEREWQSQCGLNKGQANQFKSQQVKGTEVSEQVKCSERSREWVESQQARWNEVRKWEVQKKSG